MTTALTMITRAMRLAGAIGKGEAPDDDEAADGLNALNTMLESWSTERLYAYYIVEESLTLVGNQATYTMGSGGDLNTTRPTKIEDCNFIRYGGSTGYDLQLELLNFEAYAGVVAKSTASNLPAYLFVDMQYPLVNLTFWPIPTSSAAVAHIFSWKQMQSFAALTDAISLPPGYKRAIEFSLCEEIVAEYGLPVPPNVTAIARIARANIKRINAPAPIARSEAGLMTRQWPAGSIIWGGP